jgi:hypothetical protein
MSLADALKKYRDAGSPAKGTTTDAPPPPSSSSSSSPDNAMMMMMDSSATWKRVREQHRVLLDVTELTVRRPKADLAAGDTSSATANHEDDDDDDRVNRASVILENGYTKQDLDALFAN